MSGIQEILVLESTAGELRLSHLRLERDLATVREVCAFTSHETDGGLTAIQDPNLVDEVCRVVADRGWRGLNAIFIVSGEPVSTQFLDLPPMSAKALRQAVRLKLAQQLHFSIESAIVDVSSKPAKKNGDGSHRCAVTAMRQDCADAAVKASERMGLHMIWLTTGPAALAALACEHGTQGDGLEAYLHVSHQESTLVVLKQRIPCVTSEIRIGLRDFGEALMRPIVTGDEVMRLEQADAFELRDTVGIPSMDQEIDSLGVTGDRLLPLLNPVLQRLRQQLTQWLTFARTNEDGKRVTRIHLVGPGAAMPGLADAIGEGLDIATATRAWLEDKAAVAGVAAALSAEHFAAPVAAVRLMNALPNLIPPRVLRRRRVRRVRRYTSLVCPVIALGILAVAFLFDQVGHKVRSAHGAYQLNLSDVQQVVTHSSKWDEQKQQLADRERVLDDFACATPNWLGLFKEIALSFPPELQAREFRVTPSEAGLIMTVRSDVFTNPGGRSFDECVELTLRSLQRSPFFKDVTLKNAALAVAQEKERKTGTLALVLELVYPLQTVGG